MANNNSPGFQKKLERLQKENEFLLKLLVDIGNAIDKSDVDLQQISVAIRQLRGQLGNDKLMDGALKPGLERK